MADVTQRGHANTQGIPTKANVSAASLTEAFENIETDIPTASRGLEAEVIALRETMQELIFVLKLVHGL